MKATVFVEKLGRKKYRATTSQPIPISMPSSKISPNTADVGRSALGLDLAA